MPADVPAAALGHVFRRPELLRQALTHRSFAADHNERLEFIGDGVLNCAIALVLYERFPQMPEGDLSRMRLSVVNRDTLYRHAAALDLGGAIGLGEIAAAREFAAIVPISAEKSLQLDQLTAEIVKHLPPGLPLFPADEMTDRDERFLAAEFLREKIFRQLGDELPYAAAVAIDTFAHEGDLRRIHATVYVDKANQRAILLGEGGSRMKAIASAARGDMERLFGSKVFLEVWVKVKPGWANDERMLAQLGY